MSNGNVFKHWMKCRFKEKGVLRDAVRTIYRLFSGFYISRWQRCRDLQRRGADLIQRTTNICDRVDLKPFLILGTLLGYQREQGFIKDDDDIDFGLFHIDDEKVDQLKKEMLNAGFTIRTDRRSQSALRKYGNQHHMSFMDPFSSLWVDFFFHHPVGDEVAYFRERKKVEASEIRKDNRELFANDVIGYGLFYPKDIFSNFKKTSFLNCAIYIPVFAEKYLEITYGDWNISKQECSYKNMRSIVLEKSDQKLRFKKLGPIQKGVY